MADHETAKYLADNIGGVLSKALADMASSQPADGVEFLSKWLSTYAEQEEVKVFAERQRTSLEEARREQQQQVAQKEKKKDERRKEAEKTDDVYAKFLKRLQEEDFEDARWQQLVNVAKVVTTATEAYMGLQEEIVLPDGGGPRPCIIYPYATDDETKADGDVKMTEQVLHPPNPDMPFGSGLTFNAITKPPEDADERTTLRLWKMPSTDPPPPAADPADPPPAEELPPYMPVRVDCVTDEEKVKYFDMMRLGAYLAVPVVYKSYHTKEAFDAARDFELKKMEDEKKKEEEEAERERIATEGGDPPTAEEGVTDPPADPPAPPPELNLTGTEAEVKMVLCMDTLGKNTAFTDDQVVKMMDLSSAVCECKSRTELQEIVMQAQTTIDEKLHETAGDDIDNESAEAEAARAAQKEADEGEAEDDAANELIAKKYAYLTARDTFIALRELVMELNHCVYVPPEVCNTLAGLALLHGYKADQVYYLYSLNPPDEPKLKWSHLKKAILNDAFFDAIGAEEYPLDGERVGLEPQQKLKHVQAMLPSPDAFGEEQTKLVPPGFRLVRDLLRTALDFRRGALQLRVARYDEAQAKEAEEARERGEEPDFKETPPAEKDDDLPLE